MPKRGQKSRRQSTKPVSKSEVPRMLSVLEQQLNRCEGEFEQIRPILGREKLRVTGFDAADADVRRAFRLFGPLASLFFGFDRYSQYSHAMKRACALTPALQADIEELEKTPWKRIRRRLAEVKRSSIRSAKDRDDALASLRTIVRKMEQHGERLQRVVAALQGALELRERAQAALTAMAEQYVQVLGRLFVKRKNPLLPWLGYDLSRRTGHPVPEWVVKHLDSFADTILSQVTSSSKGRAGTEGQLGLGRGQRGRRSLVTTTERVLRDLGLAIAVERKIDDQTKPSEAPGLVAAALGLKERTVRRAHKQYEEFVRPQSPGTKSRISCQKKN